jgi:uncharacterized protein
MQALEILRSNIQIIKTRFGVKAIGIFGSFSRNEEKNESDLDVLVDFEPGAKTFDNFIELKFYLEELFDRQIDLVTVNALKPRLKSAILNETVYA